MTTSHLPDGTRIRHVHLRVRDLAAVLRFYCGVLGFDRLPDVAHGVAAVGTKPNNALMLFTEDARAPLRPARTTGLYHFAIRYPTRLDLAHTLRRVSEHGYPMQGASDHGVSEALYLADPEGNGVELYADRPRDLWPQRDGRLAMHTAPLDLSALLKLASSTETAEAPAAGTDIGHVHLHVSDLSAAERFFHEFLGMEVMFRGLPSALFFSAGGYHHHIGANTWAGGKRPPDDATGLIAYRIEVPIRDILYCLRHRAPLAGYEARTLQSATGREWLEVRDPSGAWAEVSCDD